MTYEERRLRAEHHVVHDYANLVSTGRLVTNPKTNRQLELICGANGHVWHAFYMNCRKMYEFFHHQRSRDFLRPQQFVKPRVRFIFQHWTDDVQKFMNTHMLHVGSGRLTNTKNSTGADDRSYLFEFEGMWEQMLRNLKDQHKQLFKEEIQYRLEFPPGAFAHCGSLGKEFIP